VGAVKTYSKQLRDASMNSNSENSEDVSYMLHHNFHESAIQVS